jgi:hypothetical protein
MNTLIEAPKVTIESTKVNDELAGLILSPRALRRADGASPGLSLVA